MSATFRLLVLPCAAVASLACTPARNNPADPAGAPLITVSVSPQIGGRSTVFTFSATGSTPLEFAWDLHDERWDTDADPSDFEAVTGANGSLTTTLTLTSAMIAGSGGAGFAARTVRVRATDASGRFIIRPIDVLLQNRAPVADAGGEIFFSPGFTDPVVLDACGGLQASCTSTDEDGDALTFTWEPVGPAPAITVIDTDGRRAQFTPSGREATFRVTASDGLASSTGVVTAHPGHQVWIGSGSPTRLYRVFPEFSVRDGARVGSTKSLFGAMTAIAASGGQVWTGDRVAAGGSTVRHMTSDLLQVASWAVTHQVPLGMVAFGDGSACAAFQTSFSGGEGSAGAFYRFTTGMPSPVIVPDAHPGAVIAVGDGSGDCWTIGSQIGKLRANGTFTVLDPGPYDFPTAATESAAGRLWVILKGLGGPLTDGIFAFTPDFGFGLVQIEAFTTGPLIPDPSDPTGESVLAFRFGTMASTSLSVTPDEPSVFTDLEFPAPVGSAYDPAGPALWITDPQAGQIRRFVYDPVSRTWPEGNSFAWDQIGLGETPIALGADSTTGLAFASFGGTANLLVRAPPHLRSREQVAIAAEAGNIYVAGDPTSGGAWIARESEREVQRIDSRGRVLASYPQSQSPKAISALRNGSAWYGLQYTPLLINVDGTTANATSTRAIPTTGVLGLSLDQAGTVACIADGNNAAYRLALGDGAVVTTTLAGTADRVAATSSGGCWYFTSAGTAAWLPSGALAITASAPGFSGSNLAGAADPVDDSCWVADRGNSRVVHAFTNGTTSPPLPFTATRVGLYSCATMAVPTCREGWGIDPTTGTVTRFQDGVGALETFVLPLGSPRELSVVP